jgi:hypothetical protein
VLTRGPEVDDPKFKKYGNFGTLFKEEKAFTISVLVSLSDLSPQDCLKMLEVPDEGAESNAKLVCAGTQLDLTTKCNDSHQIKDVVWKLLHKLHHRYHDRLDGCKGKGVMSSTCRLDLLAISPYSFKCDDQHFIDINYNGTAPNAPGFVFADLKLTVDYKIKHAWNDLQVSFIKPGLSPTKLESFWMKSTGPKAVPPPTKPSCLDEITAVCLQEYMHEQDTRKKDREKTASASSAASGSAGNDDSQVVNKLKSIDATNKVIRII